MGNFKKAFVKPSKTDMISIVQELLPRDVIKELVQKSGVKLYWRLLTPLVLVWCFIYQRLSKDHTCDEVVSHLRAGGADDLEPQDNKAPLSQRLQSESTSSYVQGRNRLPLSVLVLALRHVAYTIKGWLREDGARRWKGHAVRWLDGTTMRMRPFGDLVETYGQAKNQHGKSYWVVARVLASFCLHSEALVAAAESATSISEPALVREVISQEEEKNSIYVSDQGLGVYRTVQTAEALGHKVVLRVEKRTGKRLWKSTQKTPLVSGADHDVRWKPAPQTKVDPDFPCDPIKGRLIYFRVEQKGFRPIDVSLFTTLMDPVFYPKEDICKLYSIRWQVEINLRQIKTTLDMEQFEVKSAQMFRKELTAGLLTYNLIRAFMLKSAIKAGIQVRSLSFQKCFRRIRDFFLRGVPDWVLQDGNFVDYLLSRLAKCTLPNQPSKVKHEPRKVRKKPVVYPQLSGSRDDARKEMLFALAA